jgi:hypothetical protein
MITVIIALMCPDAWGAIVIVVIVVIVVVVVVVRVDPRIFFLPYFFLFSH